MIVKFLWKQQSFLLFRELNFFFFSCLRMRLSTFHSSGCLLWIDFFKIFLLKIWSITTPEMLSFRTYFKFVLNFNILNEFASSIRSSCKETSYFIFANSLLYFLCNFLQESLSYCFLKSNPVLYVFFGMSTCFTCECG